MTGDHEAMERHLDALYKSVPIMALKTPEYMEYVALAYSVDHRVDFPTQVKRFHWIGRFIRRYSDGKVTKSIVSFAHNLPYMHRSNRDYCDLSLETGAMLDKLGQTFGKVLGTEWIYVKPGCWAGFAYERNELDQALALAVECDAQYAPARNSIEGLFCVKVILHSVYHALGNAEQADEALQALEALTRREPYFIPNLTAYKARYALWNGDRRAARAWLDQYYVTEVRRVALHKIFQRFVTARAHIVLGDAPRALEQIEHISQFALDYRRPVDLAEARVLEAALAWALGQKKKAMAALEQALTDMQRYAFVRVIADEGADVLPMLKKIADKVQKADYAGALDSRYVRSVYLAAYDQSKRRAGMTGGINVKPIRLSKQQTLVLTLLARGNRNAQIVEETGLSINTVKAHTRVAYEKLSVNNAADAVLQARALGLIP